MTQWFEQGLTTLAFLWRVERGDGVAFGLTSHDRDLWRAGLRYRAAPGMVPSAIARGEGLDGDDVEIAGALASALIGEDDLLAGKWDGASVMVAACDWADAAAVPLELARGTLGAVEVAGGGFTAELRGHGVVFDRAIVPVTSPGCRAELGDARCRVDLAGRRVTLAVSGAEGAVLSVAGVEPGAFAGGAWCWLDGANAGLRARIVANDGASVTLEDTPPLAVATGDRGEATHGCDKTIATCAARFGNAVNFRGEPHLPGNDVLVRYGG